MKRKIMSHLVAWKDKSDRKPLIVNGARQVGKSYVIEEFGRTNFKNVVTINFEIDSAVCAFIDGDITPKGIIQYLEIHTGEQIIAGETLIFFDEIQACGRALTSLKYFCEQAPQYHIIAAGSLLGVAINREKFSFPVGKVDEITLYPMDFEEFLWAMKKDKFVEIIKEHYSNDIAIDESYHEMGLKLFASYFIVGGMPEAITKFIETDSYLVVQKIQNNITNEYIADMAKYSQPAMSVKIRACYDSIPAQLAKNNKKFQYKVVQKGGSASIFGEAIEWLLYAGVVLKCHSLEQGYIPLKAYTDLSNFKLYMSDIGMLTMRSGMPLQTILAPTNSENTFLGGMTENYVAQVLATASIPLVYWYSEGKAEVDFVMQKEDNVIPIEVKSGINVRSRSLDLFMKRYNCPYGIRISKKNFGFENSIKSVPLYAAFCIGYIG
ncbi:MAG: ATP-binding protein [Rikenellaceae bacterium]